MTEGYEQRGEYWYERGKPAKNPRLPKSCEGCDTECMMKKLQRFCTADCANKAQFGKTVVSYGSAHDRVRYSRGSASQHPCVDCGQCADEWSYNGGDPDERTGEPGRPGAGFAYSLDPSYYVPRCVSCHRALDSKHGEEHHCAVLTEEKVREIFELYQSTIHLGRLDPDRWSHRKIADLMGVEKTTWARSSVGNCGRTSTSQSCATRPPSVHPREVREPGRTVSYPQLMRRVG